MADPKITPSQLFAQASAYIKTAKADDPQIGKILKGITDLGDAIKQDNPWKIMAQANNLSKELPAEVRKTLPDISKMPNEQKDALLTKLSENKVKIGNATDLIKQNLLTDGKVDPAKFETAKTEALKVLDTFTAEETAKGPTVKVTGKSVEGASATKTNSEPRVITEMAQDGATPPVKKPTDKVTYDAKKVSHFLHDLVDAKGSNDKTAVKGLLKELHIGDEGKALGEEIKKGSLKGKFVKTDDSIAIVKEVTEKLKKGDNLTKQDVDELGAKFKEKGLADGSGFIHSQKENIGTATAKDLKDARTAAQKVAAQGPVRPH